MRTKLGVFKSVAAAEPVFELKPWIRQAVGDIQTELLENEPDWVRVSLKAQDILDWLKVAGVLR